MARILAFDLWGDYAHYKMIYATTTAVSYPIPVKTSLYGLLAAILGMEKEDNEYLNSFKPGLCKIGIQIMRPIVMQRWNINLRSVFGPMKPSDNRKPTMVEMVYRPHYRIFVSHSDPSFMQALSEHIQAHTAVYTPTLGLANLLANFRWVGEWNADPVEADDFTLIRSVIPKSMFKGLRVDFESNNQLVEVGQYAVEMDTDRNVTVREDVLFDRGGKPFWVKASSYYELNIDQQPYHVILF
jgi:CRISPR-associated protein Cas5h